LPVAIELGSQFLAMTHHQYCGLLLTALFAE
jgi:hypothetical protein